MARGANAARQWLSVTRVELLLLRAARSYYDQVKPNGKNGEDWHLGTRLRVFFGSDGKSGAEVGHGFFRSPRF